MTTQEVDDACAGYARAVQEYPRREGIRCALPATRQMTPYDRSLAQAGIDRLHVAGFHIYADVISKLLGLSDGE